jgi:hypothetical protein
MLHQLVAEFDGRMCTVVAPQLQDVPVHLRHHGLLPDVWQALAAPPPFNLPPAVAGPAREEASPGCEEVDRSGPEAPQRLAGLSYPGEDKLPPKIHAPAWSSLSPVPRSRWDTPETPSPGTGSAPGTALLAEPHPWRPLERPLASTLSTTRLAPLQPKWPDSPLPRSLLVRYSLVARQGAIPRGLGSTWLC